MGIEYQLGVLVSDEGTVGMVGDRVDSIEKLKRVYSGLLVRHGDNNKLYLFKYSNGERVGDFKFSELEELSKIINQSSIL